MGQRVSVGRGVRVGRRVAVGVVEAEGSAGSPDMASELPGGDDWPQSANALPIPRMTSAFMIQKPWIGRGREWILGIKWMAARRSSSRAALAAHSGA